MKFVKRVHFKIVVSVLKKIKQVGMATFTPWPGARSVLTFSSQGAEARQVPKAGGSRVHRREAGGGRGYLLQSLCSMLYTSSSRLRPSKKGMRSSSSVSVMSSNQDCTGTWKTVRGGGSWTVCRAAGCSEPDWVGRTVIQPITTTITILFVPFSQLRSIHSDLVREMAQKGKVTCAQFVCILHVLFSCSRKGSRSIEYVRTSLAACQFPQTSTSHLRAPGGRGYLPTTDTREPI